MGSDIATVEQTATADPEVYRQRISMIAYSGQSSVANAERMRARMCAAAEVAKRAGVHEAEWMGAARESERALGRMIIEARERGDLRPHGGYRHSTAPTLSDIGVSKALASGAIAMAKLSDEEWRSELDTRIANNSASFFGMTKWARSTLRERDGKGPRTGPHIQAALVDTLAKLTNRLDGVEAVPIPDTGLVRDTVNDLHRALDEWIKRLDAVSGRGR